MKRYLFIHNPAANQYKSDASFPRFKQYIKQEIQECEFITSTGRGHTETIARERASLYDVIVACGGDGTVRETVSGIIGQNTCLGILPLGSGNDFAKTLGIPADLKKAVKILKRANTHLVDVGSCNDFLFINSLGFGFDGLTNKLASQSSIRKGTLRYPIAALRANFLRKPFLAHIMVDGKAYSKEPKMMITVANGRVEGGNFLIAPKALANDGLLDLIMLNTISKCLLPIQLPLFMLGKHLHLKSVSHTQCKECSLNIENDVDIHADGEIVHQNATEFKIRVLESAITAITGW